jgi:hypothetical protein
VFAALWARMIFALRTEAPFIGSNYGVPIGTYLGLVILVIATLVVIAVAVAHVAAAFRRWRSGAEM